MKSIRFIFFLAWRNVVRYRKRTLQCFLILFAGAFSVMLVDAFMKGYTASSMARIVGQAGHLDVHAAGYLEAAEAMPLDLAIENSDGIIARMLESGSRLASPDAVPLASPLIATGCMLSDGDRSRAAPVLVTEAYARTRAPGDNPVNPLLSAVPRAIIDGRFWRDNRDSGAILDEKYAKKLELKAGDNLILLGNDAYGSFSMMETPILAIVRESSLPEGVGCVVDYASFAPQFGLEGKATGISLWFAAADGAPIPSGTAEPDAVSGILAELVAVPGLEARPFAKISANYAAMFDFLDVFLAGMMAVFAIVAAVGMTNAILLSVQDRVKDLGTLRAIALTSRQAGALVYAETLIIGIAAAIGAFLVGIACIRILEITGIGFRFEYATAASGLPSMIKPRLFLVRILAIAAASALFPLLAAVLPARSARKLTIRESLGI
ncbi:MAG TPA: hypothetical protein PK542_08830 [Treponemataceae bacterium]|nr:hypothetical protein [Treponemataceae bacterium]HPS44579.1 hypothetical protein [Treponemataceae bacterium]